MTDAVLAVVILLPIALTFFLKSNAGLAILALAAGYTVESLVGSDINNGLINLNLKGLSTLDAYLILLLVPPLLTLVLSMRSWTGRSKMALEMMAAIALGGSLVITTAPFLSQVMDLSLRSSKIWPALQHVQSGIIGFAMLYGLLLLWLGKKNRAHGKKHK